MIIIYKENYEKVKSDVRKLRDHKANLHRSS